MSKPTGKLANQLHLHFIVFIWGFTAILGALISIDAVPLVWFRVLLAAFGLFIVLKLKKQRFDEGPADLIKMSFGGLLVGLHWVTFFYAIKISTISTTLIALSSSAFFVVLIKLVFERKKFEWYELALAILAIVGFTIIFKSEVDYTKGMAITLVSALLVAMFSVYNSKLIKTYSAGKITFYELLFAGVFLSFILLFRGEFSIEFFDLILADWIYLLILAFVCTAYPFVVATNLLKRMSPFTIILTNNLEPIYGIILALIIFGDKEQMTPQFYIGGFIIFISVVLNGIIKNMNYLGRVKAKDF